MRDNGENLHSGITHGCNVHRVEMGTPINPGVMTTNMIQYS